MEINNFSQETIRSMDDLSIRPAFSFYSRSKNLQEHVSEIREILSQILVKPLPFSDKEGLGKWIDTSIPWISWTEFDSPPDCFSMFFLIKPVISMTSEALVFQLIKHWLLPHEETTVLSFEHMTFFFDLYPTQKLFIAKAKILIKNKKEAELLQQNLPLLKKEMTGMLSSQGYAKSLLETNVLPLDHKVGLIREVLIKLTKRFPEDLDETVFHTLALMQSYTSVEFREQRSQSHLARFVVYMVLIGNYVRRELNVFPEKRHMKILFMPTNLTFPFGIKPVLGLSIGVNFFHKYEFFDEKHVLRAVEKFIPNVRIVAGSFYRITTANNPVTTLYVELEKDDGASFSITERKMLKDNLEEELKKRIEHLVPSLFMVRNEEETMRNILMLSREVKSPNDIPQMMVSFDQHSQEDLIFTVVFLRVKKDTDLPLQDLLKDSDDQVCFIPDRIQIVSYLNKKHPIEANVFRLQINKLTSFLRMDFSVNLYLARQKVVAFLTDHLGEIRDYNGGMMLKQGELLSQFKRLFHDVSKRNQELLENFFYSLNPIEAQATFALHSLSLFFELFLKVVEMELPQKKSYLLEFKEDDHASIAIIRASDPQFRMSVEESLNETHIYGRSLISSTLSFEGHHYLSYFYDDHDQEKREDFQKAIITALENWQMDKDKRQVLKLPCYDLVSLDPRIGGDQESSAIIKLLFDGLMRINSEGKPECSMCEGYTISEDKKQYIFKIRKTYWSNGSRLIAYDFEYAWKKVLSPEFSTPFAYVFYPIKNAKTAKKGAISLDEVGVKAEDDNTLIVDLENPTPHFIELTANTLYSPVNHVVDKMHPNWATPKGEHFVCNGPFHQCVTSSNFFCELTKNKYYWNGKNIKIDSILFTLVRGRAAISMMKRNRLDCLGVNLVNFDDIKDEDLKEKASFYPLNKISWQCFNLECYPFNNKKLRFALSMAITRKEIIQLFPMPKKREPAYTPLPYGLTQHFGSDILIQENQKLAKKYFKEALEELGIHLDDFPIIYLSSTVQDKKVSEIFKSQWEKAFGIRCEVEVSNWKDHFRKMTTGEFQVGGMHWASWLNDPIYTLQAFKYRDEKVNFTGWEDIEFQKLLDLSDQTTDLEKRKKYLADAEKILIQNGVVIPICYNMGWFIKNPSLILNLASCNGSVDFSQAYFKR